VGSLGGGGGTLILKLVHEILSVDKIGESLARSGARQPGAVRGISFAKNGNRG